MDKGEVVTAATNNKDGREGEAVAAAANNKDFTEVNEGTEMLNKGEVVSGAITGNDGVELVDKGEVVSPATHNNIGMELAPKVKLLQEPLPITMVQKLMVVWIWQLRVKLL